MGAAIANVHPLAVSAMGRDVNFGDYGSDLSHFQRELTLSVLKTSDPILSQTHCNDTNRSTSIDINLLKQFVILSIQQIFKKTFNRR